MFKKQPKVGYLVNLLVTIACISIFSMFILKSQPFFGFLIGLILAIIINSVLGAKWKPEWKSKEQ